MLWLSCNYARRAVVAFMLTMLGFVASASAAERPAFRQDRILIVPKADKAPDTAALHRKKGRQVAKRFPAFKNLQVVKLAPGQDVLATVQEYMDSGLVEVAE